MSKNKNITNGLVGLLFEKAAIGIIVIAITTIVVAYIFKDQFAPSVILGWLAFMLLGCSARYLALFDYNKNKDTTSDHAKFEMQYALATGLIGLGWAAFIITVMSLLSFEYRMFCIVIIIGVVAISVPVFSSSQKTLYFYVIPSLVTSVPLLLIQGDGETGLGLLLALFFLMVLSAGRDNYNTFNDNFALRYKTQNLTHDLHVSQQRLLLHRKFSPVGIIEWNVDFEVIDWNSAAAKLFGYSKEEAMGRKGIKLIIPKSAQPKTDTVWKELLANKGGSHNVNKNLTKDGASLLCEWYNTPLVDDGGHVIGVTSMVTNVTERQQMEESLRKSQQRLVLQRDQSPVGMIEWSPEFKVVAWNPAAERIFGYSKDEVMGEYIIDKILPESARAAVDEIWEQLLRQVGGTFSRNENLTKDGRTILCEWHNTPIIGQDGSVIGISAIVDDITASQKQEKELRQRQKMDAIGQLTGGIAHDFNNMLGVVLGFSELLKERLTKTDPSLIEYCDEVLYAGDRAKQLTAKLLEFSRIAPSSVKKVKINEIIWGMEKMLTSTLTPSIKLVFDLEENIWPVSLDIGRLEDAILNLSINSMHAMPDGGRLTLSTGNKRLRQRQGDSQNKVLSDFVVFSISDTGCGMSKDVQQKMFDPFFSTKGTEGTGLGLSQIYGYIEQANGHIEVYSEPGYGTKITLCIPRLIKKDEVVTEEVSDYSERLENGEGTILVVDDEPALLNLNEMILSEYGYTVICADSGERALEILENEQVDLLLSDVIMGGMGGYELAAEVEKLYPKVKIQMMSGFIDDRNVGKATQKLHQNRLQKPFAVEDLLIRIKKLMIK